MKHVANNIGRALVLDPRDNKLLYLSKENPKEFVICKLSQIDDIAVQPITKTIGQGEDFTCTVKGEIVMADANKVYVYQKGKWNLIFDGKDKFAGVFNRIALSPDNRKICIVYQE